MAIMGRSGGQHVSSANGATEVVLSSLADGSEDGFRPAIDRTPKLFIGGKQVRPDSGYSRLVRSANGRVLAEVGEGNRKDVRNAVEAAQAAVGWAAGTGHNRAQVLYYIAENLAVRTRRVLSPPRRHDR